MLRIRLTADQKERLETAAKRIGVPVSTWLLSLGLKATEARGPGSGS